MNIKLSVMLTLIVLLFIGCGGEKNTEETTAAKTTNPGGFTDFEMENGIGPIKAKVQLAPINPVKAKMGKDIFDLKCGPCHKIDERFVGPSQRYTADRRTPEYILNMILLFYLT